MSGLVGGWLALKHTFFPSSAERAASVGLFGARAPLGAWVAIWGSIAMITSGPFDDWWHNAYGLDVKIVSPPHAILGLGMFGVSSFSAIINPPQAAILAVAAGQKRPVVKNGELAIATVMTCTLSADHRVIDGALGASFMAELKRVIEDPLSLML